MSPITKTILTTGWFDAVCSGGGISFIVWFSVFVSFSLILQGINVAEITLKEKLVCFLSMFICLFPSSLVCWCSLFLLCVYLSFVNKMSVKMRMGFLVLSVVAVRVPLIQFCMSVFSGPLLQADAFFVYNFLSFFTDTASFQGNIVYTKNDYSLAIMTGCSSFDNLSLAILLWFTLVCSNDGLQCFNRVAHVFILSIIIIFLNTVRLSLMAWSKEFYSFFHEDMGLVLIELSLLSIAFLMAMYTNRNGRKRICSKTFQ